MYGLGDPEIKDFGTSFRVCLHRKPFETDPFGVVNPSAPDDDDEDGESLSVYEAAEIWRSNGMDEDYTFGYSEDELRDALG